VFPDTWTQSTIGELCDMVKGAAQIVRTKPGQYPLVTTGEDRKTADHYQFDTAVVCVPMISAFGHGKAGLKRVQYQEGKFALANILTALIVRDPSQLLPRFLHLFLNYFKDELIVPLQAGAANMGITITKLATVPVAFPSLDEQQRILRLIDQANELNQLRARADERMAEFIPALFNQMFGDPATNPKGWKVVPVSAFVDEFQGGRSILTDGSETKDTKYRILKVSAVTWGEYQPQESKPVPSDYQPLEHHFVRKGDLLFSRANTTALVGATVYVFDTPENIVLSDKLWRFVWHEPQLIDPLYVWALFLNHSIRRELGSRATGTGGSMKNISKPKVLSMPVPLPPLALQRDFAARVAEARALQDQQARSQARLEEGFQALLHRAFAGEL
jgi:type I restriction enzyme, S subunit